jgi:DNA modification methylase
MNYSNILPISEPIKADRQGAKRHYGVHPYFTRRPHNVVRAHILNFTRPGDTVLDPFGGSGVTAIEALLSGRRGIQNDINPLANFIADGIADLRFLDIAKGLEAFERVLSGYDQLCAMDAEPRSVAIEPFLPPDAMLPKNSDVKTYRELFSQSQITELASLKAAIEQTVDKHARSALLLAWSATLSKSNKTFISTTGRAASRGGSSIFSIYRYKIAKDVVTLNTRAVFCERFRNIMDAKREIDRTLQINRLKSQVGAGDYSSYSLDVLKLPTLLENQVDYIFTDPPYGAHIAYLDLSTLWNVWLKGKVSTDTFKDEVIVGGSLNKSEEEYHKKLKESIVSCLKMLKRDRWMSVVFQHSKPSYFAAILDAAAESGAELKSAVSQIGDVVWSMHKKKNGESVFAGEFILTFYYTGTPPHRLRDQTFDVASWLHEILRSSEREVFSEALLNNLVLEAWNRGTLEALSISKEELNDILKFEGFLYDANHHCWRRQQNLVSVQEGYLF